MIIKIAAVDDNGIGYEKTVEIDDNDLRKPKTLYELSLAFGDVVNYVKPLSLTLEQKATKLRTEKNVFQIGDYLGRAF